MTENIIILTFVIYLNCSKQEILHPLFEHTVYCTIVLLLNGKNPI